jgi:hypothetical protein
MKKNIILTALAALTLACSESDPNLDPHSMSLAKESADAFYTILEENGWEKYDSLFEATFAISENTLKDGAHDTIPAVGYTLRLRKGPDTLAVLSGYFEGCDTLCWNATASGEEHVVKSICHSNVEIVKNFYSNKTYAYLNRPKSEPIVSAFSDPSILAGKNFLFHNGVKTNTLTYCETYSIIDIDKIHVPADPSDKEALMSAYRSICDVSLVGNSRFNGTHTAVTDSLKATGKYEWLKEHQYVGYDDKGYKLYSYAIVRGNTFETTDYYIRRETSIESDLEQMIKKHYPKECPALGIKIEWWEKYVFDGIEIDTVAL